MTGGVKSTKRKTSTKRRTKKTTTGGGIKEWIPGVFKSALRWRRSSNSGTSAEAFAKVNAEEKNNAQGQNANAKKKKGLTRTQKAAIFAAILIAMAFAIYLARRSGMTVASMKEAFTSVASKLLSGLKSLASNIYNIVKTVMVSIRNGIGAAARAVGSAAMRVGQSIKSIMSSIVGRVKAIVSIIFKGETPSNDQLQANLKKDVFLNARPDTFKVENPAPTKEALQAAQAIRALDHKM